MSIDFSSLDFSPEAIKKMREQAEKEAESEAIELAKKKERCLDSLLRYLNDLRRIRDQYTEYRMYYWNNDPSVYNEPKVSNDEKTMDRMIKTMESIKIITRSRQVLGRGYRKDNPKFEEQMNRIHKAAEE